MLDLPVSHAPRKHTLTCAEGRKARKGRNKGRKEEEIDRGKIG
jgi:hypothetical protein